MSTNPIINASPSTTVNNSSGSVIINSYDHIKVDTEVTPNNTTVSIYSIGYLTVGGTYSVSSPWVFAIDLSTLFQIITLDTSYAVNISIIYSFSYIDTKWLRDSLNLLLMLGFYW